MTGRIISLETRRAERLPEYLRPFRRWSEAMAHVALADAAERIAWADYQNAVDDYGRESAEAEAARLAYSEAFLPRVIMTSRAMMTHATDKAGLLWKERSRKMAGGSQLWEEAIEADRRRLEKQKPGAGTPGRKQVDKFAPHRPIHGADNSAITEVFQDREGAE